VQLQWSLVERGAEREMIPPCRAFGLGVLVWSPLGRGLLSGKYQKGQKPPAGARLADWKDTFTRYDNDITWSAVAAAEKVAKEVGATPARVSLAWLLAKPEVSSVIIGARTEKQLDDNLAAASLVLSPAHLQLLDKASEPAWGYPYDFIGMRERW
jgi:aryl-alcohol dehydrogenase-like predicted oxidoreductase